MLTIWLHVSQRKRLHLIHVIRIIYEEAHNLNGTHKCQQANMLGQRSHFFIQDKNKKYFICIFLLIPANMVDKSIVRYAEERFDQTLKYSKSNITMHISTLRIRVSTLSLYQCVLLLYCKAGQEITQIIFSTVCSN